MDLRQYPKNTDSLTKLTNPPRPLQSLQKNNKQKTVLLDLNFKVLKVFFPNTLKFNARSIFKFQMH